MKFIRKGRKPAELGKFQRENAATAHVFEFDALPPELKHSLAGRMLNEQGRLCAYTMRRIGAIDAAGFPDFHFEHIQPRRHSDLRLDYRNLVLCSPGANQPRCGWGAKYKGDTEVNDGNFVSPLRSDCETRLSYRVDALVREANAEDSAAKSTIELLNLNHRELVAERTAALRSFGLVEGAARPIGARAAERLSRQICERDADGKFEPFCIAVQQVAANFARKALQRAGRLASRQSR